MAIKMRHAKMRLSDAVLCACLAFIIADPCTIVAAYDSNIELFEGSPCDMEIGNEKGQCVSIMECPIRIQQILRHQRTTEGRCGFKGKIEIVCCPLSSIRSSDKTNKIGDAEKPLKTSSTTTTTTTTRAPPTRRRIITTTTTTPEPTTTTTTQASTTTVRKPFGRAVIRPSHEACTRYERIVSGNEPVGTYIINGVKANFGELPFMAAIFNAPRDDLEETKYACTGSLISEEYVLTAAHCVRNKLGTIPAEVKLGAVNVNDNSDRIQNIKIKKSIAHPEYDRKEKYHDIALLRLERPVNLTKNVFPLCLQTVKLNLKPLLEDDSLIAAGWGRTVIHDIDGSENLMQTPGLQLVNHTACNTIYKNLRGFEGLTRGIDEDGMLCLTDRNTTRHADACQGDSGGPLFLKGHTGLSTVVGVVSFGKDCGTHPGVYVYVNHYLDWIESIVWPSQLS